MDVDLGCMWCVGGDEGFMMLVVGIGLEVVVGVEGVFGKGGGGGVVFVENVVYFGEYLLVGVEIGFVV